MTRSLGTQRLLALFAVGWLLFDFPILRLWQAQAFGFFVAWAVLIGALAFTMERRED